MLGSLHMLGAIEASSSIGAGEGLKGHFIVIKVDRVDGEVLKRKLAASGSSSAIAPLAMLVVDDAPKDAINVLMPTAMKQLEEYGVHGTAIINDDPNARGIPTKPSGFFPGLSIGATLAAVLIGAGWGGWKFTKWLV
jgi:hypothetical protein